MCHTKKTSLIITILFLAFGLLQHSDGQSLPNYDFSIILSSCFKGDTIGVKVNGIILLAKHIATSDFSTDLTGTAIYQTKDALWISSDKNSRRLESLPVGKTIIVEIVVNCESTLKTIMLNKGKIIMVDYCYSKIKSQRAITFQQHKKSVIVE